MPYIVGLWVNRMDQDGSGWARLIRLDWMHGVG